MNLKGVWGLLRTAAAAWAADGAPRLGAALSYYTVFAISPLLIIVIFVASLWYNKAAVQSALFDQLSDLVGPRSAHLLESTLTAAAPQGQGKIATAIAICALVLTATGFFLELQGAMNTIWGVVEKSGQGIRGFLKNRLLSFALVVGIGFLLLVSLVVTAAFAATAKYISALMPGLGVISMLLNDVLSFAVITVLFAMIFKVLPDVKVAWRDVWVGAAVTALLFTAGKFLLGLYLVRNATVSAYGAAGSLVLLLLWVYYSAQILFFGAEVTQAYANFFGKRLEPKPHARWRTPEEGSAKLKPQVQAAQEAEDRKARLVAELREQVDALRAAEARMRPRNA